MIISAMILALRGLTPAVEKLWNAPLAGRPILQHMVQNCEDSGVIDELCIVTDEPSLLAADKPFGLRVYPCPVCYQGHPFNFLNIEQHALSKEFELTLEAGLHTDVTFFLPWNMPFLDARTIERMYHTVLDDPLAARVLPMCDVDPQLFARVDGVDGFFPVWAQKGLDRQLIQQLYRVSSACVTHWNRLLRTLPKITGMDLSKACLQAINSAEELELAEYLHGYLAGQEVPYARS